MRQSKRASVPSEAQKGGVAMYVVYRDGEFYGEYKSPIEAELVAASQRRFGYTAVVDFDEGSRCTV